MFFGHTGLFLNVIILLTFVVSMYLSVSEPPAVAILPLSRWGRVSLNHFLFRFLFVFSFKVTRKRQRVVVRCGGEVVDGV